jgi:hypothetical protein
MIVCSPASMTTRRRSIRSFIRSSAVSAEAPSKYAPKKPHHRAQALREHARDQSADIPAAALGKARVTADVSRTVSPSEMHGSHLEQHHAVPLARIFALTDWIG